MMPPGRGQYRPQGHGWQDLYRRLLYIATQKYENFGPCGFEGEDFFMFYP